ncbi:MAG: HAD family hydrolase [Acidobacteria bacterium]|nr:HAD family hydrolase [Acidobacteriota bacterium]MCA1609674.1 HAD family hydrolase [Acidobacteriota bacterium]
MTAEGGRIRAVLFDWDGTLLDSAEASFRCYRRLFQPYGIDFTPEVFARTYAPDWYRTYEGIGLPRDRWGEADARWLEIYADESCGLRPGAAAALARLAAAGVAAGLVTSGSRSRVERDLAALGVSSAFSAVVCGEDARRKKPDPEALRIAIERLGVPAARSAYVGDSPEDVEMARASGVFAVGLEGGFPNAEALRRSAPEALAGNLAEAVEVLLAL